VSRALLTLLHVVVAITCFDIIVWTGNYYWRKLGVRALKEAREAELKAEGTKKRLLACAKSVDSYIKNNRKPPRRLAEVAEVKHTIRDFWGNEMRLEKEDGAIYVVSPGADGKFDTKDDLREKVGRNDE